MRRTVMNSLIYPFAFVVFAIGVIVLLLLFLCEQFYRFKVLTSLFDDFWEIEVMYTWVRLICIALFVFDNQIVPHAID